MLAVEGCGGVVGNRVDGLGDQCLLQLIGVSSEILELLFETVVRLRKLLLIELSPTTPDPFRREV